MWWESREECNELDDAKLSDLKINEVLEACGADSVDEPELDDPSNCLERVLALERRLNEVAIGMEETVRLMIASAIAQQPFLMIGPPGVAKTMVAAKTDRLASGMVVGCPWVMASLQVRISRKKQGSVSNQICFRAELAMGSASTGWNVIFSSLVSMMTKRCTSA